MRNARFVTQGASKRKGTFKEFISYELHKTKTYPAHHRIWESKDFGLYTFELP